MCWVFGEANEFRYLVRAKMTRDFLTIPVTTIASLSTFSASGRVFNEHRSSLSKDTVETLICIKDWLFTHYCSHEIKNDELTEDIMIESDASSSVSNLIVCFLSSCN